MDKKTMSKERPSAVAAMKKGPRDGVYRYTRDLDRAIEIAEREHIHNMSEIKSCQRELRHTIHSLSLDKAAVSQGELILDLSKNNYFLRSLTTERPKPSAKSGKGRDDNDSDQSSVRSFQSSVSFPSIASEHPTVQSSGVEEKKNSDLKFPPPGKGIITAPDTASGKDELTVTGDTQIEQSKGLRPRSASLPAIFDITRPVLSRNTTNEITTTSSTTESQRRYSSMSLQVPRPETNITRNRSLGAKSDVGVKVQQKLEALKWKYSKENLERMKQLRDEREAAKEAAAIQEAAELDENTENDEAKDTGPSLSELFDDLKDCRYLRPRKY